MTGSTTTMARRTIYRSTTQTAGSDPEDRFDSNVEEPRRFGIVPFAAALL
jgi:hypothetical protein